MGEFLKELTRRKVWLFGGIYLALGWILLQVAALLESTLKLPDWIDQSALVLLVIGFPVALLLAWAQESQKNGPESEGKESNAATASGSEKSRPSLSVAVLPFNDLSRDGEFVEVADGVPEDILTQLTLYDAFEITARNSSFAYRDTSPDIRIVGEELGVRYVLEGSFRKVGDEVRLTGQLIETRTGAHTWSNNYDLPFGDYEAALDDVVDGMVGEIMSALFSSEHKRLSSGPPEDLSVQELLMLATWNVGDFSLAKFEEAGALIDLALKKDPDDGPVLALKARIEATLPNLGAPDRARHWQVASDHLERAKKVGPHNMETLGSMAAAAYSMGRHSDLKVYTEQMLAQGPKHPATWGYTGAYLLQIGKWQEALDAAARGKVFASPRSPYHLNFVVLEAGAFLGLGNFGQAEATARAYLAVRENQDARGVLVVALAFQDRVDEAGAELDVLRANTPNTSLAAIEASLRIRYTDEAMIELYLDGFRRAGLE